MNAICAAALYCVWTHLERPKQRGKFGRHAALFSYFAVSENFAVKVRDQTSLAFHIERFSDQHHNKLRHSCRQWHSDALYFRRTACLKIDFSYIRTPIVSGRMSKKAKSIPKKERTKVGDMITHFINCLTPQLWDYIDNSNENVSRGSETSVEKLTFTCKLNAIWRMYIMFRSSNIHSFFLHVCEFINGHPSRQISTKL